MKKIPLLFCLVLFFAGFAAAQSEKSAACPTIDVAGGGVVEAGVPMSFTVHVEDYDLSKLSFKWTTSVGRISNGQGTVTIGVSDYKSGENVTATVEVEGLPEGCPNTASETGACSCDVPSPSLIDEFGSVKHSEIRLRMDMLFIALGNQPNAQGYIINYGTNKEIARREAQLRNHIGFKKYDVSRVTFVRGGANPNGERGVWTKFWIVPPGAMPPTP